MAASLMIEQYDDVLGRYERVRKVERYDMESVAAVFAGTAFALFGAALLVWTGARALHRAPVLHGVSPVASTALTTFFGVLFLALGVWCFMLV
ncbi:MULTISPECIES: hypothetical protein [Streptomyces]|nr:MULTISPECIES: hypothetical protein [Streptomyces]MCR8946425.1 hypothetical protein [Streptomyces sp. OUCMDZ-4982]MDI7785705.1 hypothetical protein [Streptomyces cavourensis]WAE66922.1 hypothetical protein OUQ49_14835 [Streptomyces cavourensis]